MWTRFRGLRVRRRGGVVASRPAGGLEGGRRRWRRRLRRRRAAAGFRRPALRAGGRPAFSVEGVQLEGFAVGVASTSGGLRFGRPALQRPALAAGGLEGWRAAQRKHKSNAPPPSSVGAGGRRAFAGRPALRAGGLRGGGVASGLSLRPPPSSVEGWRAAAAFYENKLRRLRRRPAGGLEGVGALAGVVASTFLSMSARRRFDVA